MSNRTSVTARLAFLLACVSSIAIAQVLLKSPTQVHAALSVLNRVVDHTQRLITAKNYTRLPHENMEFVEGAQALEKAIANEPSDFKSKVEPLLKQAQQASQQVADAATAHDDSALATAHAAFASSVGAVVAVFPDDVHPSPPNKTNEYQEESGAK